jgi:hypothetical protein
MISERNAWFLILIIKMYLILQKSNFYRNDW